MGIDTNPELQLSAGKLVKVIAANSAIAEAQGFVEGLIDGDDALANGSIALLGRRFASAIVTGCIREK